MQRSAEESGWAILEGLSREGWSIAVLPVMRRELDEKTGQVRVVATGEVRVTAIRRLGQGLAADALSLKGTSVAELAPTVQEMARAA